MLYYNLNSATINLLFKRIVRVKKNCSKVRHRQYYRYKYEMLYDDEICAILHWSKRTIHHYRKSGSIPDTYILHHKRKYYSAHEIENILIANTIPAVED